MVTVLRQQKWINLSEYSTSLILLSTWNYHSETILLPETKEQNQDSLHVNVKVTSHQALKSWHESDMIQEDSCSPSRLLSPSLATCTCTPDRRLPEADTCRHVTLQQKWTVSDNTARHVNPQLEALYVNSWWTVLVVLFPADKHVVDCGQWSQDGAANPDKVPALWWGSDPDIYRAWCYFSQLLVYSLKNAWEEGVASRQHDICVHCSPEFTVTLLDWLIGRFVDPVELYAQERRAKQGLCAEETLMANGDHLEQANKGRYLNTCTVNDIHAPIRGIEIGIL